MSPILQRLMSDLRLLSPEEQWKLLSYLVNQLRAGTLEAEKAPSEIPPDKNAAEADEVLQATQGCWGNKSIEDIDASLDRQRQFDWVKQNLVY